MERSIVARSINILCSKISLNDSTYKRIHLRIIGGKFGVNCASPEGDLCGGERRGGCRDAILICIDRNAADLDISRERLCRPCVINIVSVVVRLKERVDSRK